MTLEELADLIRASSSNTNRRMEELHAETYGKLMNLDADMTEVKSDVPELRKEFDLAGSVVELKQRIAALEAEIAALKKAG